MKKYHHASFAALLLHLCLSACQDTKKNDYPANYVGFERPTQEYHYSKENSEETLELKIIAVEKENTDRVVKLSGNSINVPGESPCFQLTQTQVTIKANQKSAITQLKIFPQYVIKNANIRLTCTPQWKAENAKQSHLSIRLTLK